MYLEFLYTKNKVSTISDVTLTLLKAHFYQSFMTNFHKFGQSNLGDTWLCNAFKLDELGAIKYQIVLHNKTLYIDYNI